MPRILRLRNLFLLLILLGGCLAFWIAYHAMNQPKPIKIGMTPQEVEATLAPYGTKFFEQMFSHPSCYRDGRHVPLDGTDFQLWILKGGRIKLTIGFRNGVVSDFCYEDKNYF